MNKYKETIEFAELITKYLKGELSFEEEQEFRKRMQNLPQGSSFLEHLQDSQSILSKIEEYESFDMERSWKNVQKITINKNSKILHRNFFRWVAIFALPLAIATLIFFSTKDRQQISPQYIVNTYFELNKTILELPGGECIALDTVGNVTHKLNHFGVSLVKGQGLDYSGLDSVVDAQIEYHKIVVPRGGEYQLKLSDGTRVWMFAESEIRFPSRFEGRKREVYLSGEAYFEVHHDKRHPFYVKTKSLDVKVLGTSFNVKAYSEMEVVETSLVEGIVSLKNKILSPNTQAVFHKSTGNFSYRKINGENYRLRKERIFVFNDERLDDILHEMARWYDFDFFYQNPEIADKRFGFKLEKYKDVNSLLDILELTGEVKFSMKGKTLTVMEGT